MEMVDQLTLHELLESAIQQEVMSRFLYISLRQRMKSQATKDAFQGLADEEEVHQRVLEDYLHGRIKEGGLNDKLVIDYKITDCLNQPAVSPTMDLKEVFHLAAIKEKASHDLYNGLATIHPNGEVKRLLENLASQELEHKKRVEDLYLESAFPQTDGG
jgi:rubrerythrin